MIELLLVDWNHKEMDRPWLLVGNVGMVTYWEEADTRSSAAFPTTFVEVLTLAPLISTALYALPPEPRFATEVPDTVLVSKE